MTGLALVCAALAAWWAIPRRPRVPGPAIAEPSDGRSGWRLPALGVLGTVLLWTLAGPELAVPATAAGVVTATGVRVWIIRERGRRARRTAADIALACTVLASELDLGRVPTAALAAAAADCPVLLPAATAARIGGDVVQTWERQAAQPGHHGLRVLSRAWQVSTGTGAALAPSLATVAAALTTEEEVERTVAGELAAPRMTGVVLALLPVAGIGLGYAIGGDPLGFLLGSAWGWACLLGGTVLACAGLLWTERLAATG
ncbi:type II secretion system F family protein [Granulicoccus sp. GXG6511]|uniref:type II secretion system F family protein n=1 Tax=Granulicoccus sp. GXG6511 TaxID=3381351 RepID=UPI003D7C8D34